MLNYRSVQCYEAANIVNVAVLAVVLYVLSECFIVMDIVHWCREIVFSGVMFLNSCLTALRRAPNAVKFHGS